MSFFDTLKSMGLFQPQQGQPAQQNPYGLDPATMRQARMDALGNIGGQILAMSQQMTPDQRARMMANADWTGGMQGNLMNAAQMQLMGQANQRKKEEQRRAEEARTRIAEMIKQMPPGRTRDAAMYFLQAGDLEKAGEVVFTQKREYNAMTGGYDTVDMFGQQIGQPMRAAAPAATASPDAIQTAPLPVMQPAVANQSVPIPAPDAGTSVMPEQPVDQVTTNWRRLTGDPSLTPQDARMIMEAAAAGGNTDAGLKVYREIVKNRQDLDKEGRQATKDQSEIANTILDDRTAAIAEPQKVVQFAQSIEDALASGNPTGMRALATQVLFAKALDPNSAFMTGEAELQQAAASVRQKVDSWWNNLGGQEGAPVPPELVLEMRDIARRLGRKALKKIDEVDLRTKTRAGAFGISDQMLGGPFELRWNRFADPVISESGTGRREPREQVIEDLMKYGG